MPLYKVVRTSDKYLHPTKPFEGAIEGEEFENWLGEQDRHYYARLHTLKDLQQFIQKMGHKVVVHDVVTGGHLWDNYEGLVIEIYDGYRE